MSYTNEEQAHPQYRLDETERELLELERQLNIAYGKRTWPDGVTWAFNNVLRAIRGHPRVPARARHKARLSSE